MVIYLPEVENRGQREMAEILVMGSVSMETLHPHSAPLKAVLPSANVHLSWRDQGGRGGGGSRRSRRSDLIGFLDNSWCQKQVRSIGSAAHDTKTAKMTERCVCMCVGWGVEGRVGWMTMVDT